MECKLGNGSTLMAILTCLKIRDKGQRVGLEVMQQGLKFSAVSEGRDVQIFGWYQGESMRYFNFQKVLFYEIPLHVFMSCLGMFSHASSVHLRMKDTSVSVTVEENMAVMDFDITVYQDTLDKPWDAMSFQDMDVISYRSSQKEMHDLLMYLLATLEEYDKETCYIQRTPEGLRFTMEQTCQAMQVRFPPEVFDSADVRQDGTPAHTLDEGVHYRCGSLVGATNPIKFAIGIQMRFNKLGQLSLHCLLPQSDQTHASQSHLFVEVVIWPLVRDEEMAG